MDNLGFTGMGVFKELPHMLETWWKTSVEIAKQVNSDLVKNISVSPREWLEVAVGHTQTFGQGFHLYSSWWIVPIIVLFTATVPLYLSHNNTQKRLKTLTSNIPGPLTIPILGNVPTFAGCNLVQFFEKLVKVVDKYGPIVRFWMGDKLYIVITDPDSIENILANKTLIKKNSSVSKIVNGNGLIAPDDEKWKIHRRIISSTFNSNVLEQFMENFVKNGAILSDSLHSVADGSTFDIYPLLCQCTLDIICETTMGTNVQTEMEDDPEFKKNLLQALETLGETFKKPWLINDWIHTRKKQFDQEKDAAMKYLHKFVDKVVADKMESRRNGFVQNGGKQRVEYVQWVRGKEMSLLELLIQDDQLSLDEIRDELCTLIVAGTKVTATSCCYALSLLGEHQDIQEKVLEEQEKVFGPDLQRPAAGKDLISMKYLEQVMKETMRLYPPVPFLFRTIEEDTKLENGYILPKDSYAVIFNYITHRNPDYYPAPENFNPNRFSLEDNPTKHPYAYIPFGGGRRICVAYKYGMMEAKAILSTVLRKYHVTKTPGGVETLEKNLQAGVVLKPANGFSVQMVERPIKMIPRIFRED